MNGRWSRSSTRRLAVVRINALLSSAPNAPTLLSSKRFRSGPVRLLSKSLMVDGGNTPGATKAQDVTKRPSHMLEYKSRHQNPKNRVKLGSNNINDILKITNH